MEYVKGSCLTISPVEFNNIDYDSWYPILDGDHALVRRIGDPISFNDLISVLESGDSLVAESEEIDQIDQAFPDVFYKGKSYWAGESTLTKW